jgi:hypothetical protein
MVRGERNWARIDILFQTMYGVSIGNLEHRFLLPYSTTTMILSRRSIFRGYVRRPTRRNYGMANRNEFAVRNTKERDVRNRRQRWKMRSKPRPLLQGKTVEVTAEMIYVV